MSSFRVLPGSGCTSDPVDSKGEWDNTDAEDDLVADLVEEIRCHSLEEPMRSAHHRSSWPGFDETPSSNQQSYNRSRLSQPTLLLSRPISPGYLHVMHDARRRQRSSSGGRRCASNAVKERSVSDGSIGLSIPQRLLRVSRDATQPTSGSMSDLRRAASHNDDEEMDVLPALGPRPSVRPRAFTCPDIKVIQRKTKIKLLHRPPTPTPGDEASTEELVPNFDVLGDYVHHSSSGEIFPHEEEPELPAIAET